MIHRLGTELIPVDESWDSGRAKWDGFAVEPVPGSALPFQDHFSTGLSASVLILASSSAIRRQMLDAAGVEYRSVPSCVDEASVKATTDDSTSIASKLAISKALAVCRDYPDDYVVGGDSVISVDGHLFDKPRSRDEAAEHLRAFSGRTMLLTSAVAMVRGGVVDWTHSETARLRVRPLSEQFIQSYLDHEWPDVSYCVGVFRLEGRGVQLFDAIAGDYFAILGMPLIPLLGRLRALGMLAS